MSMYNLKSQRGQCICVPSLHMKSNDKDSARESWKNAKSVMLNLQNTQITLVLRSYLWRSMFSQAFDQAGLSLHKVEFARYRAIVTTRQADLISNSPIFQKKKIHTAALRIKSVRTNPPQSDLKKWGWTELNCTKSEAQRERDDTYTASDDTTPPWYAAIPDLLCVLAVPVLLKIWWWCIDNSPEPVRESGLFCWRAVRDLYPPNC